MTWTDALPEKPAEGPNMPVADAPRSVWDEVKLLKAQNAVLQAEVERYRSIAQRYAKLAPADSYPPHAIPERGE